MCTMPSVPSNGVIESGIPDKLVSGVVIKYGCNVGFVINGSSEITCIDGDWSDDSPDCVGKIFMTTQGIMKIEFIVQPIRSPI